MSQPEHGPSWKREPKLVSRWAEGLSLASPLPEYPRPQLVRDEWLNLNGEWEFLGEGPEPPELPAEFPEIALVPSATQAVTSCLEKEWTRGWYRESFEIPAEWGEKKILLHFESIGGVSTVYLDGKELGTHTGCYYRFTVELPDINPGKEHTLVVHFDDRDKRLPRGKPLQLSGIWQTVWMEPVPESYIESCRLTPDIDAGELRIEVDVLGAGPDLSIVAETSGTPNTATGTHAARQEPRPPSSNQASRHTIGGRGSCRAVSRTSSSASVVLSIPHPTLWSPESPFLYDLTLELKQGDTVVDRIESYFGMRKIEWREVDGTPRILLNSEVYYQAGLLDQGEWPESFFTPPSDEALKWEIEQTKAMGFNVLRKHVKIEAARWYYWCDMLGMLVWQDLPFQWEYLKKAHETEEDKQFMRDGLRDMIEQFYNHPSIICWVIFNEAWGQFEPEDMTRRARELDSSRLINTTSHVWPNDFERKRYNVDLYDVHDYSRELGFEHTWDYDGRPDVPHAFGEFGGIGYLIKANTEKHEKYSSYGPNAMSAEELLDAYRMLILQARALRDTHSLCAIIYTEITDWIKEINGFITYDRKVVKVDVEKLREINELFLTL